MYRGYLIEKKIMTPNSTLPVSFFNLQEFDNELIIFSIIHCNITCVDFYYIFLEDIYIVWFYICQRVNICQKVEMVSIFARLAEHKYQHHSTSWIKQI